MLTEPKTRRWTEREYHEAADLGWFNDQRVELIRGEVVIMPPQKDAHAAALRLADYALRKVFGEGYVVCVQTPMNLGADSEPEPNLAVVRGSPRSLTRHPKAAVLVVEIADTTLMYDRVRKARLYASRGIRDYWVSNLIDRQLEVFRRPVTDNNEPFGFSYAETAIFKPGDAVSPLAAREAKIRVSDLLP